MNTDILKVSLVVVVLGALLGYYLISMDEKVRVPPSSTPANMPALNVQSGNLVFERDGVKVYRFHDYKDHWISISANGVVNSIE